MRWFKHMTRTWQDEKMAMAVELGGLEAYGLYFRLLEIIAGNMEEGSPPLCEYSPRRLARDCNVLSNRLERLLKVLEKSKLICVTRLEGLLKVEIPKILKYRDEHTRKQARARRKTPERLRSNSRSTPEQELELELERELETEAELEEKNYPPHGKAQTIYTDLLKALDKIVVSPKEVAIAEKLILAGCTFDDIAAARKLKGKNQLAYLQNIVCEMRDRRTKTEAADENPFLQYGNQTD